MSIKILPYQLKKQISQIKTNYFFPSLNGLKGNVLEIGYGKEENFKYYSKECSLYAIDKRNKLLSPQKIENQESCKVFIQKGNAEQMPFQNDFFEAVVASFVFCSVDSVEKAVQETKRVLKKGGKLILLEHIKSNNKFIRAIQGIITKIQALFSIECHLNRDPRNFIKSNSFQIIEEKIYLNSFEPYLYLETIKQ